MAYRKFLERGLTPPAKSVLLHSWRSEGVGVAQGYTPLRLPKWLIIYAKPKGGVPCDTIRGGIVRPAVRLHQHAKQRVDNYPSILDQRINQLKQQVQNQRISTCDNSRSSLEVHRGNYGRIRPGSHESSVDQSVYSTDRVAYSIGLTFTLHCST